jgi:hypothetical protein
MRTFKMKNLFATLCLIASTIALSACETASTDSTTAPYAMERTASHGDTATDVAPAEEVFQKAQNK